ncbi:MAG: UDP-3-O-[3-hydroxymyristoyl] N-acetylglucosamine deacetylase, partial [Francisellaceae bacterium]
DINTGILCRRVDLSPAVDIPVKVDAVQEALMCSVLVNGEVKISTIEHLMSALCMLKVDNIIVEVDAPEIPVMDGSSSPFLFALKAAGIKQQEALRKQIKIIKPVRIEHEDKYVELTPSDKTSYRFEIQWDHPVIAATPSVYEFDGEYATYEKEISRARTFGFVEELAYLHANNLAKGASLDNAVGVSKEGVVNDGGLRYEDEFVKHKMLDAIGDFYVGGNIVGHFNAYKSGHKLNNLLLRKLFSEKDAWELV